MDTDSPRESPVARLHGPVLDAPDLDLLTRFWQQLLGYEIERRDNDWVALVDPADDTRRLSLQLVTDRARSRWPEPDAPMQVHLDLFVDDVGLADERACRIGAERIGQVHDDGNERFFVYHDPAGHTFCLIQRLRVGVPG